MARIGNYELIDKFATGGVAEIYRARNVATGEIVVVKRIRPDIDFDPEQHAGFERELSLAMMCTHKNLIRGFEHGTQNGFDYGVLEYVDGQDLGKILTRLKRGKRALEASITTYVLAEVLDGLDFAYRLHDGHGFPLGLVHRDLAPKNVFVRYDGQVRVGDFGSAIATLSEPESNVVVGSVGYMSPEQARAEPLDARTDVYAAGLLLFEMLTGQQAYDVDGKRDVAVLKLHQRGQMRPIPSSVPDDLRLVIEIATSPDREDRYKSARDMRQGLMKTDTPPDPRAAASLAEIVRMLFVDEFKATRI